MKVLDRTLVISILAATTATGHATESGSPAPNPEVSLTKEVSELEASLRALRLVRSLNGANALFVSSGSSIPCSPANTLNNPCPVDAKVIELFNDQKVMVACAIQTSNITIVNAKKNDEIFIAWNLILPTPQIASSYKFERPHGILITRDDDDATGKKADTINDLSAVLKVTYKNKYWVVDQYHTNGEVEYYPLVKQTQSGGTIFLCGAGDPKIVNN